jgi:hypothetical protein
MSESYKRAIAEGLVVPDDDDEGEGGGFVITSAQPAPAKPGESE